MTNATFRVRRLDLGDVKEAVRALAGSTDEVGGTIRFVAENGEDL